MNPEKQKELRSRLSDGLQFQLAKRKRLDALPKTVSPGDLFLFPVDVAVSWCAIFTHSKDNKLWYIVPGDEFSEVGTHDVAVPDFVEEGPLNFRCGFGIWVHFKDFNFDHRIGQLDQQFVEQIRDHLSRIVRRDLPTVESLVDTDDDPDYVEWMEELSAAVQEFEQQLLEDASVHKASQKPVGHHVLLISDFRERRADELSGLISPVTYSLAAESESGYITNPEGEKPLSAEVPFQKAGKIYVVKYDGGIVVQAFGVGENPPEISTGDPNLRPLNWHRESEWFSSSLVPFENGQVVLSLGDQSFVIQK